MPVKARRGGDYTGAQVAGFLCCSHFVVYRLLRSGSLPHYRLPPAEPDGRWTYRVTRDELLKWLLARPEFHWAIPAVMADRPYNPYENGRRVRRQT